MYRPIILLLLLVVSVARGNESQQTMQEPDLRLSPFTDESASSQQLSSLQRNVSALWSYIYELRGAVTHHLNHLRQHQVEMEEAIHRIEHHGNEHGDSHASHTADHSSHSGEHGGSSHQHSHSSGEHHGHSSSGEHHHHSGEHQSHSDEHHSHDHDSHSHSHSHTDDSGAHGDHGHDHKDSHENADDLQQTSQVSEPLVEPVVVPTTRQSHSHHHHHSHGDHSHGGHGHSHSRSASSSGGASGSSFQPLNVMGEDSHHHIGHGSPTTPSSILRNRTRAVTMPKYSEYDLYDFATCNVQPNRAIPVDLQQNIVGQISLWQRKSGGPLNIHVRLSGFSMGDHGHHHQSQQQQEEDNETPQPAMVHKHGFHVHTLADFSNGCQTTGPHYNPKGVSHGGPNALVRHVGDLGNIECDDHGFANLVFSDSVASLKGQYSIVGKSMVIHSGQDDLGLGGDDESLRTGNAGVRLACCEIGKVDKLPIRSYKAMKTALQYQNY